LWLPEKAKSGSDLFSYENHEKWCERMFCVGENPTLLPAKFFLTSQPQLAKTTMTHPISETNLFGIGSPEYRLLKAAAASMDFHWSDAGTTPGIQISCIREAKATRPILESIRGPKKSTDRFLYCTIDRKR
jgi:hypothetical protein